MVPGVTTGGPGHRASQLPELALRLPSAWPRPAAKPDSRLGAHQVPIVGTLALLTRSRGLTGSQRPQARGHARPRPAIITPAERHVRPRSATTSDATKVPPK